MNFTNSTVDLHNILIKVVDKIDSITEHMNLENMINCLNFTFMLNNLKYLVVNTIENYNFIINWHVYSIMIIVCMLFICSRKGKKKNEKICKQEKKLLTEFDIFDLAKTGYEAGHTERVIDIVETTGYDVNYSTSNGLSLFLCACVSGQEELIRYLLDRGGDIKSESDDGDTALYLATFGILSTEYPNSRVLKLLINSGCDVNKQNKKGFTPLHRAASKGNIDIIKCLLNLGANPHISNNSGVYPLDSAINAGHLEAAKLLTIDVDNPHVWDVVEPHTPTNIALGLKSPQRKVLLESSRPQHSNISRVFT